MSILNQVTIETENCNAIFTTYKIPKPAGIYNNTIYVLVQSQIIDDYLLDELIQYNTTNKFIKNIFYFTLLNDPDPNDQSTWVVQFTPSSSKWIEFSTNLKTLAFNFAFVDNQIEAEHFIPCNLVNYIFIGATQNFQLFETDTQDTMNTLNNSLPRIKLLVFNSFGKVQMSQNCIDFTNNLVNRGVTFIH
jgi:hypothetical protein